MKFYKCNECGNVIITKDIFKSKLSCCNNDMEELKAGKMDGAIEKHVPVYEIKEGKLFVKVGEVSHPMQKEHHISFIVLEKNNGYEIKNIENNSEPSANFEILNDEVKNIYAYCNLHGLWKANIKK